MFDPNSFWVFNYDMSIAVLDQGPELFWFVSNALLQDEIPLKHIQSIDVGEKYILQELPQIVIINGDDKSLLPEIFIGRMRNHVFARNTLFIVMTSDISSDFKKSLLIAGAGQVLYRGRGFSPSPKFFASLIKWFLTYKSPEPLIFDYKPVPFLAPAEFTSYGRIGWISENQCLVETNINLNPGQSIEIRNTLFEELEIKNLKLECIEKNKVGRYYQYSNSLLCKIESKDRVKDAKKLSAWIENNHEISKHKPIKLVYFESDANYRNEIKQMIKTDKRYCARGYSHLEDFQEVLEYQMPHLLLINRDLIQKNKSKFDALKSYMQNHFCFCITYSSSDIYDLDEFKKNYPNIMHSPKIIELDLLESMISKLEKKLPQNQQTDEKKIFFNKHSPYSRLTFHSPCRLTELALCGVGIELPFNIANFCPCEISSHNFTLAQMGRGQFFRSFSGKANTDKSKGIYQRLIFMGQNIKDNELVKITIEKINAQGFDSWAANEPISDKKNR